MLHTVQYYLITWSSLTTSLLGDQFATYHFTGHLFNLLWSISLSDNVLDKHSTHESIIFTPPSSPLSNAPLPLPPASTCAFTTAPVPPSDSAIFFASFAVPATSPLGMFTPACFNRSRLWYSCSDKCLRCCLEKADD